MKILDPFNQVDDSLFGQVGAAKQGAQGLESNPYCAKVEEADGLSKIEYIFSLILILKTKIDHIL